MTVIVKQPFTHPSPLRELCGRYAGGKLSREDFLIARTQLLDQLAGTDASDEDVAVITAPLRATARTESGDIMAALDADTTAPQRSNKRSSRIATDNVRPALNTGITDKPSPSSFQQPEQAESGSLKKSRLIGIAAVAIIGIAILGAGVYFFMPQYFLATGADKNAASASLAVSQPADIAAGSTAGDDTSFGIALHRFESAPFNSASVDVLLHQWQSLDENQKLSARSTPAFMTFKRDLISRRDSLLALSQPNNTNADAIALLAKIAEVMALTDVQKGLADQTDLSPAPTAAKVERASTDKADASATVGAAINPRPTEKSIDKNAASPAPITNSQIPHNAVSATPINKQPVLEQKTDSAAHLSAPSTINRNGGGCSADQLNSRKRACHDVLKSGGDAPELVVIASGAFMMGGDGPDQSARHQVEVKAFAIGRNEITVAEYAKFCQSENITCPKSEWGDGYPVVDISWQDANNYLHWLSVQTGVHYRLPTEAEWEYVARAGTNTSFPWPGEDSEKPTPSEVIYNTTKPVDSAENYKSINPNPWKIFHMQGNVREWVQDSWSVHGDSAAAKSDAQYVVRGGDYRDTRLEQLNAAARLGLPATSHDKYTGFRVARDL